MTNTHTKAVIMSVLLGMTLATVPSTILPTPAQAEGEIWSFEKVLGRGKGNFRALCTKEKGTIEKIEDGLKCVLPEYANVSATFEGGIATLFGMEWAASGFGMTLLSKFREVFGREDLAEPSDGCKTYWWVNPEGDGLTYVIGVCSKNSYLIVGLLG